MFLKHWKPFVSFIKKRKKEKKTLYFIQIYMDMARKICADVATSLCIIVYFCILHPSYINLSFCTQKSREKWRKRRENVCCFFVNLTEYLILSRNIIFDMILFIVFIFLHRQPYLLQWKFFYLMRMVWQTFSRVLAVL